LTLYTRAPANIDEVLGIFLTAAGYPWFDPCPEGLLWVKELNRSRGMFPGESSHEAHWRPV
jgi:hypothetical protein